MSAKGYWLYLLCVRLQILSNNHCVRGTGLVTLLLVFIIATVSHGNHVIYRHPAGRCDRLLFRNMQLSSLQSVYLFRVTNGCLTSGRLTRHTRPRLLTSGDRAQIDGDVRNNNVAQIQKKLNNIFWHHDIADNRAFPLIQMGEREGRVGSSLEERSIPPASCVLFYVLCTIFMYYFLYYSHFFAFSVNLGAFSKGMFVLERLRSLNNVCKREGSPRKWNTIDHVTIATSLYHKTDFCSLNRFLTLTFFKYSFFLISKCLYFPHLIKIRLNITYRGP